MKKLIPLLFCLPLFGYATAAHALNNSMWSMMAGGCVSADVDVALQGTHYWTVTGGMRVKHKGTDTNDIHLVCPVNLTYGLVNRLELYYANDGDLSGSDYYVKATLRGVSKLNGLYTADICTATSSSNNNTWAMTSCSFDTTIDTTANSYWVDVTIHRASALYTPEVNGVDLAVVQ